MAGVLNADEFNDRVKQLLQAANIEFPAINARVARTALSLVRNRIINEGKNGKGQSFGKYSTNPLPTFFFTGKGLSAGADQKLEADLKRQRKAGVKNPGVSYEAWRDMNNLQTNHVDLKFSGDTLKDIDVIETRTEGSIVTTVVASKDSITRTNGKKTISTGTIMDHLAERYGDFLEVTDQETVDLIEVFDEEVQQLVDSIFEK